MPPYLAAIGIIASAAIPSPGRIGVLAAYVVVMALPALVLLAARHLVGAGVTERLERLRAWLIKHSAGTVSLLWLILGIQVAIRGAALVQ